MTFVVYIQSYSHAFFSVFPRTGHFVRDFGTVMWKLVGSL